MTTEYDGEKEPQVIPICKKHNWIYIRNVVNNENETADLFMCSKCHQKMIYIWDEPELKLYQKTKEWYKKNKI